jgi:selenocysteine lyase/cysteine desulfurase
MIADSKFSRRKFLGGSVATALGVAAAGLLSSRADAQQARSGTGRPAPGGPAPSLEDLKLAGAPDEAYWRKVRSQFDIVGGLTFLNNGTLGPVPRYVGEFHERWDRTLSEDPTNSFRSAELDVVRRKIAGFVNAGPDEVALTRSTTEGMNIFAHGLSWKAGDEVIVSTLEHFGATDAYKGLEQRFEIKSVTIDLPPIPESVEQVVAAYEKAITANTRVIVASHVAYINGLILPIKELADLAHSRGILLSVDGAQSFGALPLDVKAAELDHYAAPGQKWLLAGTGTGFMYIRKDLQDKVLPLMGAYSPGGRRAGGPPPNPSARRYEQNGQYNIPGALGIGAAVDFQQAVGKANIEARARELGTRLRSGLKEIRGVKLWTSADPRFSANLTTFAVGDQPAQDVAKALLDKAGIVVRTVHTDEINGIRVSTHFYNHPGEVDRLLGEVRALAG